MYFSLPNTKIKELEFLEQIFEKLEKITTMTPTKRTTKKGYMIHQTNVNGTIKQSR